MSEPPRASPFWSVGRLALASGCAAALAVLLTLGGPGITVDEPLDVRPGRTYITTLRSRGWRFFEPEVVETVFRDNAEHPPLGRWLLGLASCLGEPLEILLMGGADPLGLYVHAARVAPALAFALLVALVVNAAGRRLGRAGGLSAGFALVAMPRVFGHAHLAALDTFVCLFWTLALLGAVRALERPRPILAMIGAGMAWGLALLTKIHAWFLAPIVFAYWIVRYRTARTLAAVAAWGAGGLACYVLGWPWLWYHTIARLKAYWGTGMVRSAIHVLYFGRVYADRDVPWHYPWFYFAATVPVGLQALGVLGLVHGWKVRRTDPVPNVLAGSIVVFLALFSTRVPVYDGERLFLLAFPLWAMLIGQGFAWLWGRTAQIPGARTLLAALLIAQGYGLAATHPFELSYHNALVGGLPGAERLGLELTYWNDAVDRVLLDRLAREVQSGATAALAPTLYPGQGVACTTRAMSRVPVILGDEDAALRAEWVVVSRRSAYWKPPLQARLAAQPPLFTRSRQGVWLSAIWKFGPDAKVP